MSEKQLNLTATNGQQFQVVLSYGPDHPRGVSFSVGDASGFVAGGDFPLADITGDNIQTELTAVGFPLAEDQLTLALVGFLAIVSEHKTP